MSQHETQGLLSRFGTRLLTALLTLTLAATSAIAPATPARATDSLTVLSYPTIDEASAEVGERVYGDGGSSLWTPSATSVIYRWYRCTSGGTATDTLPSGCVPITNARNYYYNATEIDVGYYLRFAVTGYRGSASSRIWSAAMGPVTALPNVLPQFTGVSPLEGEPMIGTSLGLGNISLVAYPETTSRTVAWWRCSSEGGAQDSVSDCVLTRAARLTDSPSTWGWGSYRYYYPTNADIGFYIRAQLTIVSPLGSDTIFSPTSEMVYAPPAAFPYFTVEPEITSDPPLVSKRVTRTFDYTEGSPSPLTVSYGWYSCVTEGDSTDELPTGCARVSTSSWLAPTIAMLGKYLRFAVTLTNPTGSVAQYSATSAAVEEPDLVAPTLTEFTSISSAPVEGLRLGANYPELSSWGYPENELNQQDVWYSCTLPGSLTDEVPADCQRAGSGYWYTPKATDVGRYLRASRTYSNSFGSSTSISATSVAVAARPRFAPTVSTTSPSMTGLAMVGQQLLGGKGEWSAFPTQVAYTYRWYRCTSAGVSANSLPSGCTALSGTSPGYRIVSSDLNRYMRLAVTATNSIGSSTVWSAASAKVVSSSLVAPTATGTPCIALGLGGDPYVGASILDTGCSVTFTGNPGIVGTTSAWYRCNTSDIARTSGSSISGCVLVKQNSPRPASGPCYEDCTPQYTLGQADVGKHLRLAITGTNSRGKATSWSATIGPVVELPAGKLPIAIFPPNLLDAPVVGEQFWQDGGAWVEYGDSDYAPIQYYVVRWYRCASAGEWSATLPDGCNAAPGTNSTENYGYQNGGPSTYTPVASDAGYFLRAEISARNSVGWSSIYSATSSAVTTPPNEAPTIVSPVTMYHSVSEAYAYVGYEAVWRAYPDVDNPTYQWYRCTGDAGMATDARPANCSLISGATSSGYSLSAADAGFRLRVRSHGENAHGEANSFSATSGVIANPVPRNMGGPAAPRLSGGAAVGFAITASSGTWDGPSDLSFEFSYAWYSCTAGGTDTPASVPGGCTLISGETGATFTPKAAHRGRHIRVAVTANNGRGTGVRFSSSLGAVGSGPSNTAAPTVSGSARIGQQLSAAAGTWSGSPTFAYTWWRCTVSGSDTPATPPDACARISGATGNRFTVTAGERGWFIRVSVTGTASGVSVTRFSRTTVIVP
jgi:hypothetical protein